MCSAIMKIIFFLAITRINSVISSDSVENYVGGDEPNIPFSGNQKKNYVEGLESIENEHEGIKIKEKQLNQQAELSKYIKEFLKRTQEEVETEIVTRFSTLKSEIYDEIIPLDSSSGITTGKEETTTINPTKKNILLDFPRIDSTEVNISSGDMDKKNEKRMKIDFVHEITSFIPKNKVNKVKNETKDYENMDTGESTLSSLKYTKQYSSETTTDQSIMVNSTNDIDSNGFTEKQIVKVSERIEQISSPNTEGVLTTTLSPNKATTVEMNKCQENQKKNCIEGLQSMKYEHEHIRIRNKQLNNKAEQSKYIKEFLRSTQAEIETEIMPTTVASTIQSEMNDEIISLNSSGETTIEKEETTTINPTKNNILDILRLDSNYSSENIDAVNEERMKVDYVHEITSSIPKDYDENNGNKVEIETGDYENMDTGESTLSSRIYTKQYSSETTTNNERKDIKIKTKQLNNKPKQSKYIEESLESTQEEVETEIPTASTLQSEIYDEIVPLDFSSGITMGIEESNATNPTKNDLLDTLRLDSTESNIASEHIDKENAERMEIEDVLEITSTTPKNYVENNNETKVENETEGYRNMDTVESTLSSQIYTEQYLSETTTDQYTIVYTTNDITTNSFTEMQIVEGSEKVEQISYPNTEGVFTTILPPDNATDKNMNKCQVTGLTLLMKRVKATKITTRWSVKSKPSLLSAGCNLKMKLSCSTVNDNITMSVKVEANIDRNNKEIILHNLPKNTSYNCECKLKKTPLVRKFSFTTLDKDTFEPFDVKTTVKSSSSFLVTWKKPEDYSGSFLKYIVEIENLGTNHFVSSDRACHKIFSEEKIIFSTLDTYLLFTEALPDFTYRVRVRVSAPTNGKFSNYGKNITTPSAASDVIRDIIIREFDENCNQTERYNCSIELKFKEPCNTNGVFQHYIVKIFGARPGFDTVNDTMILTTFKEPNMIMRKIRPQYNYTFEISVRTDQHESPLVRKSFLTSARRFPKPTHIKTRILSSSRFVVSWNIPEDYYEPSMKYFVEIENLGARHLIYNDSSCTEIPPTGEVSLFSTSKTSLIFNSSLPNFSYRSRVKISNPNGDSPYSDYGNNITTPSTAPGAVRDINIMEVDEDCYQNEFYNCSIELTFKEPCNTNGIFRNYSINIIGRRPTFGEVNSTKIIRELNETNLTLEKVEPQYNYTFEITVFTDQHRSPAVTKNYKTRPRKPPMPTDIRTTIKSPSSFDVSWLQPEDYREPFIMYGVEIENLGASHLIPYSDGNCSKIPQKGEKLMFLTSHRTLAFSGGFPNFNYRARVKITTASINGSYSNYGENITTPVSVPDSVRDITIEEINDDCRRHENYNCSVKVEFKEPCNTNGVFQSYTLRVFGTRPGHEVISYTKLLKTTTTIEKVKAEYTYNFEIQVKADLESSFFGKEYVAKSGFPPVNAKKIDYFMKSDTFEINVSIRKGIFSDANGDIICYNLRLLRVHSLDFLKYTFPVPDTRFNALVNIQITEGCWQPFTGGQDRVDIAVGPRINNYTLEEHSTYCISLEGSTRAYSRDHEIFFCVKTGGHKSSILVWIIFIFVMLVIAMVGTIWWMKTTKRCWINLTKFRSLSTTIDPIEDEIQDCRRHVVSVKQFSSYYNKVTNDPMLLKKQYEEIEDETKIYKEAYVKTTAALQSENRRKNRYTNILPYDEFRVKLNIVEDDEISTDYINASYIKGFTGRVEYIAAQGPLEHTCHDFWKMVIQEKVTMIVMVSLFVEKGREKCFKYFPNNHENMLIGEDLELTCLTELYFEVYCVRTLVLKQGDKQYNVVHMQFLEWPDFGCPKETENLLYFCQEVRDRIQLEKGLMVVHCSAGVGRTGTLISLDILLQAIIVNKTISIFECVLELRKQRTHMVQTEKQYVYIHTCIKNALENASKYSSDDQQRSGDKFETNKTSKMKQESVF